ncbi:alpha/beta hydrolase family protein [Actinomadura chokoriensis]|uniref:Alpha/beta fold hydrolase n=1 Tax=Actinomadura chokoriensis TaxID=454156 RepID=A0ABV4R2P8_9ACTN
MTPAVPVLPRIPSRSGFAFSADGRWAACLSTVDDGVTLERWSLDRAVPSRRAFGTGWIATGCDGERETLDRHSRPLPLDDGRVLLARPDVDAHGTPTGHGTVVIAQAGHGGTTVARSCRVPAMLAGHLLAGPGTPQTVVLVTVEDERRSRIWELSPATGSLEPIMTVPGVLAGGVWLDGGRTLALDHTAPGRRTDGIAVDLRERSWRRVWSVSSATADRIVACDRGAKVLAVTTGTPGARWTGTARIGLWSPGCGPVRFPEALNAPDAERTPLTFDASGGHLLVSEVRGATSRLVVHTAADDRVEPVDLPPGTLSPPASWTGDRIHLRYSAPHRPPTLATAHRPPASGWSLERRAPDDAADWRRADLVELPGPAGPIEAIVYGGPGWRESERLVLALHGGPLSAWRLEFDPLFQHLAAAGIAVVAPNYRGSTGYGARHLRPVIGDWGGPDLEDVLHLARGLAGPRRRAGVPGPIVLGGSYGGFLALLAACHDPERWSGCVALAPFTSAASLYRDATGPVRDRVARLNGRGGGADPHTGRDVLRACDALTAPLLLAHGIRDEVIPVAQSRALRRRLLELGRTEGAGLDYVEVDGDHTGVVQAWPSVLRTAVVRFCLGAERIPISNCEGR